VSAPADYDDGEIGGMMIGKETEVLGENLPQCRFVHHKTHMPARTRTRAAAVGIGRYKGKATIIRDVLPRIRCLNTGKEKKFLVLLSI
jgi:hypothetical protein